VSENRVLREVFGPKREEVIEVGQNCIMRMRWVGHIACMEERSAYNILVREPEEKRSLGRPTCRCDNNIIMNLKKKKIDVRMWTGFIWLRI
jgi:hypothetical protein